MAENYSSRKKCYSGGTRNLKRLTENIQAESIHLSVEEVTEIDDMLEHIPMSQVFGGSIVKK